MVLDIRDCELSIYLAGIQQEERQFLGVLEVHRPEVYLEVLVGEELFVGHLDGNPRSVQPASEVYCLGSAV